MIRLLKMSYLKKNTIVIVISEEKNEDVVGFRGHKLSTTIVLLLTDQICYIKLYCVFKNKADTNVDEIDFFVVDPYTRK